METGSHESKIDTAGCPAFTEGCPYASEKEMRAWVEANRPDALANCDAFKDGSCPFKAAESLAGIQEVLATMPPSHLKASGSKTHGQLVQLFATMHASSARVKAQLGDDANPCPVFSGEGVGCPFKGVLCSDGVPLVDALEYRSWDLARLAAINHQNNESSAAASTTSSEHTATASSINSGTEDTLEGVETERVTTVAVSKLLKEGTKVAHKAAENVHYVREFIHGRVTADVYRQMVANLWFVYSSLESALDKRSDHPLVAPVHFPEELRRAPSLELDLDYYWSHNASSGSSATPSSSSTSPALPSKGWRAPGVLQPSPVAKVYAERLEWLSQEAPELLVAHAYTRYLGDLSGGQVLKRAAIKGLHLTPSPTWSDSESNTTSANSSSSSSSSPAALTNSAATPVIPGVAFYDFALIPNLKKFKQEYRRRLDSLGAQGLASEDADRMVAEANYAFALNTALFQELDLLAGFGSAEVQLPDPPPLHGDRANLSKSTTATSSSSSSSSTTLSSNLSQADLDAQAKAAAGGCPFASLVRAGSALPDHHGAAASSSTTATANKSCNASTASSVVEEEGCPLRRFKLLDVAVVLVLIAAMLLAMPSPQEAKQ